MRIIHRRRYTFTCVIVVCIYIYTIIILYVIIIYYCARRSKEKLYYYDWWTGMKGGCRKCVCVCLRVQQETKRPRRKTGGGGLSRSSLTGATLYLFFLTPHPVLVGSLRPTTSEIFIFFDYSLGDGRATMISICRTPRVNNNSNIII